MALVWSIASHRRMSGKTPAHAGSSRVVGSTTVILTLATGHERCDQTDQIILVESGVRHLGAMYSSSSVPSAAFSAGTECTLGKPGLAQIAPPWL